MKNIYNLLIICIIIPNVLIGQTDYIKNRIVTNSCNYDFRWVIDNDMQNYPVRIDGTSSGCIGPCAEIPRNIDLYYAILLINQDYNGDSIISISDLPDKIKEVGDINNDKLINIYDIIYPEKIKYFTSLNNQNMDTTIKDYESVTIMGDLKLDGRRFWLTLHHTVTITDIMSEANIDQTYTTKLEAGSKIHIGESRNLIMYKDKTVILKGSFDHGITQSYPDYFMFGVHEIIGIKK